MRYNVSLRKLLSARKSYVWETSLVTGAIPNQARDSQTSLFLSMHTLYVKHILVYIYIICIH